MRPTRGFGENAEAPSRVTGRAGPPLLFGLAPRGVCRAADITARAVGSYPTVSPLPSAAIVRPAEGLASSRSSIRARRRFIFCGTVRSPAPAFADARSPGVTRRVALRSPDFPPVDSLAGIVQRSPSPLAPGHYSASRYAPSGLHSEGPMRMNRVCEELKRGVPEVA